MLQFSRLQSRPHQHQPKSDRPFPNYVILDLAKRPRGQDVRKLPRLSGTGEPAGLAIATDLLL